jgi:hypothetical protein
MLPQDLFSSLKMNYRKLITYKELRVKQLKEANRVLNQPRQKEQAHYKSYYDRTRKTVSFAASEQVMVYLENSKEARKGKSAKLLPYWDGPYTLLK